MVTLVTLSRPEKPDTVYDGSCGISRAVRIRRRSVHDDPHRRQFSMTRRTALFLVAIAAVAIPSLAFAADSPENEPVMWVIGIATLLAAIVLLVIALGLARVARGSAMADNISYVVLACICLAGSVLATWIARYTSPGAAADQVVIGGQALVIAAIALFGVYFFRVRAALGRFLSVLSDEDALARAQMPADGSSEHVDA
jgi:4-amino-4-deoxy-L-arabinose transferase-like glycosyltransferase